MAFDLNGSGGDQDIMYDSGSPRRSMYLPRGAQGPLPPTDTDVANPPTLSRYAPPPEAPITADHMGPQSPLDYMLGKYNESENAYKSLLEKGPDQFKPSIWRRLAGFGLGTVAGMSARGGGYGRYSNFSSDPRESFNVAQQFTFGPQAQRDAKYKRDIEAARVGSDEAMKDYQLTRQQGVDDLQQRNVASEIEARNRPQIVEGYRVPQTGGPAEAIPIMPETLGEPTNLPEVIRQKERAPIDARAQAEADREKFAQEQQGRQFTEQEKLQQMRDNAAEDRADKARTQGAGMDRSYQFHTNKLVALGKPIGDRMSRIGNLRIALNQNDPQSLALTGPELLTAMAGGQGSGLRMNEAEIARIVGGRSNWETLKATVNKWKTNPEEARSITEPQRQQMLKLTNSVAERISSKQNLIDDAQQRLADAQTPNEHKQIYADLNRRLAAIDNIEDTAGVDSRNGRTVYRSGGKLIYNDGTEPPK